MAAGVFYIIAGLAGSLIVGLFLALPTEATSALAGLALLPVLAVNFRQAFSHEETLLASVMAFIVTASGINFLGINSSFWGLLIGLAGYYFLSNVSREK
jgi:benzoate membrane transport protein